MWTLLLWACSTEVTPPTERCGTEESPCVVADGEYLVREPEGLSAPAPVVMFFHGYSSSAARMSRKTSLVDPFLDAGWMMVFPDGRNNTWAHVGSPSSARDELAFLDSVQQDVESRFAVDTSRWVAAGFSQGGSMVWDLACYRPGQFAAFAPVSGGFWEPLPSSCEGAVNLRHEHGTADETVPLEGRPIGSSMQGDIFAGFEIWADTNGCASSTTETRDGQSCIVYEGCAEDLQLCLHDGGHGRADGWEERTLAWLQSTVFAR